MSDLKMTGVLVEMTERELELMAQACSGANSISPRADLLALALDCELRRKGLSRARTERRLRELLGSDPWCVDRFGEMVRVADWIFGREVQL